MKQHARIFTIKEQIGLIVAGAKGFVYLRKNRKHRRMTKALKERIMLAVTQVNGCAMCSFIHTKLALDSGMTPDQIRSILGGDYDSVPDEETVAVLFGQHYADSKEHPSQEAIDRLIETYGFAKAECVLAACQMITMTNGMGISMDHFYHRITFRRNRQSKLRFEVFNPLMTMVFFPLFVIGYWLKTLISRISIIGPKPQLNQ